VESGARIDGEPLECIVFVGNGLAYRGFGRAPPRLLNSAELIRRRWEATVTIEKIATDGTLLGKRQGFLGRGRATLDGV